MGHDSSISYIPGSNSFIVGHATVGHSGLVRCVAENEAGVTEKSTLIDVSGETTESPSVRLVFASSLV